MANGQVLFRISGNDGKRILGLNTSSFYISSKMKGESGTTSDESVLYNGTFSSVTTAARESLTSQLTTVTNELNAQIAALTAENAGLTASNATLNKKIEELNTAVVALTASNQEMSNELAELTKELSTAQQTQIQQNATDAQALSEIVKSSVAQVSTVQGSSETVNPKEALAAIRTLARSNQRYIFGGNPLLANLIKRTRQNR
jgi:cell division protein FtsB